MADTLEDIRKHVEELIRRLSEAEAQPAEQRPERRSAQSMGDTGLDELVGHVNVLGVKVDQAGNLLAQVTDLLESQAERLETLEQQVGEPEPAWLAPQPAADPEPAPAPDLELARMVSDLLETVRSEVGMLSNELRERTQGLDARINELCGRFDDMRELTWQHRSEMRNLEERLLIVAESSMQDLEPAAATPASEETPKLAIREVRSEQAVEAVASIIPIASPEIIEAVEGAGGCAAQTAVGGGTSGVPVSDVEYGTAGLVDSDVSEPMEPMDARTVRRLEELVEREVRLQQEFSPGAPAKRGHGGRPSVMVVDDLPDARQILSIYLSRTGYHVVTASGAEDCLAKLRHHRVDAVVLDASMPGGGGAQVCRTLREDPLFAEKRDLPVVIYTAYPDEHPPSVVEAWGATDYVVKGGDMLPLITALVRHTKEEPEAVT